MFLIKVGCVLTMTVATELFKAHRQNITWHEYFSQKDDWEKAVALAPQVLAEAVYASDYDNAVNNKDDWLDRSNPLLLASPEGTYEEAKIFIVNHFREFKEQPPFPVVGLEGTGKVAKHVFIYHVSRKRDPWHFNAPMWK